MESYYVSITSKIVKAKFRASSTELLQDFSALLNTKVTSLDQLAPQAYCRHQKLETRKRRTRKSQPQDQSVDGILGFASFLGEAEECLTGTPQKESQARLMPSIAQSTPTPLDFEDSNNMQSQTYETGPTSAAIKQTSILKALKPACLNGYIESQYFSVSRRTKSTASQAAKSATGDLGLMSISHLIIEQIYSEPEVAKKQKVGDAEETELGLVL
jgi:hypothetical protein